MSLTYKESLTSALLATVSSSALSALARASRASISPMASGSD